jgi:tight adherence protein C
LPKDFAEGTCKMMILIALGVFGMIAAVTWVVVDSMSKRSSRTVERLDEIRNPGARRDEKKKKASASEAMVYLLESAAPALAKPLLPKKLEETNKLKERLEHAGIRSETAPTFFLSLKFISMAAGFVIGGGTLLLTQGLSFKTVLYVLGVTGAMFYLPEMVVGLLAKRRKQAIFLALPDALDLMVVCVEAGLALDQAMRKVAEEMKKSYPVLAYEFGLSNLHLQMGRTRTEALQGLGRRTGVDDLKALASILIQADKFGSSIAQALRVQSDAMRTRRRQIAEEKAAKTAVKLIFPLVIFIFPGIFIVLVGPAAITMVREMFPAMKGG